MILKLEHKKLDVYEYAGRLVTECYKLTTRFPPEEKFGLVQQLRRAAISVKLNISEGASRRSVVERKRFYEISRSSLVEMDAAIEIALNLKYIMLEEISQVAFYLEKCFKILSKFVKP